MATSRAVAVETAHAATEFSPQNDTIFQMLQQINKRLENVEVNFQINSAQTANLRVICRNTRLQGLLELLPLHKSVPGYGRDLALPFINVLNATDQQTFHTQFPPNGNAALLGTKPLNFDANVDCYEHFDILRMMVFYNETFFIVPEDDLPHRINKFRRSLTEF